MSLQIGDLLQNRYRLEEKLGEGGYGAVYRAWDLNFELVCSIKENRLSGEDAQRQFLREARILHTIRHPNLPLVKDYFVIPGKGQFLVMDFIDGEDLQQALDRSGTPLPEDRVLEYTFQVMEALDYLHHHEPPVIHRDIKPANIKITPKGKAMLVDFGISKIFDPNVPTTQGARAVTPGYSPFEQYGHAPTDARTDVYSLGATLYTLMTGEIPPDSIARMAGRNLTSPKDCNPNISTALDQAILKAMAPMPEDRFVSIQEFRDALSSLYVPKDTSDHETIRSASQEDQIVKRKIASSSESDLHSRPTKQLSSEALGLNESKSGGTSDSTRQVAFTDNR